LFQMWEGPWRPDNYLPDLNAASKQYDAKARFPATATPK
jgi:hypothetical protein